MLEQGCNRGFTGGCNAGMEWCLAAGCDYVLLLNNDTAAEPDFLSRLMDHADPNCLVVPKIYFYDDRTLINSHVGRYDYWRGLHQDWFYRKPDSPASRQAQFAQMANGCALLIPKEILQRVGMLDEQFFMYAEDVDFITRAVRAGAKILFVPDAVIYHRESSSSGGADSPLSVYYNNRNRPRLLFKHQKNPLARSFFVLYFSATRMATSLRYLRRGQRAQLSALWRGVADALRGRMGIAPQQRSEAGRNERSL